MAKKIRYIALALCIALCLCACTGKSYGDEHKNASELSNVMAKQGFDFLYPEDFENEKGAEYHYISQSDYKTKETLGYKIYRFGSPFFTCVYAYHGTADTVKSDNIDNLEKLETIASESGDITVYSGKGHEDALFLIGIINIGENHYECRVTANKDMEENKYINAIYKDNAMYAPALQAVVDTLNTLK